MQDEGYKQQMSDIGEVLSTRSGRAFIWRLLDMSGVFRTSFSPDNRIYYNEGRRSVGLQLFADIMSNFPGAFTTMQGEAAQQKESKNG